MFYDPLFDLNRDGRIDSVEFAYMDSILNPHEESEELDEVVEELEMAGLDYDDLDMMEAEERREALEDAGLDPDDFDDDF